VHTQLHILLQPSLIAFAATTVPLHIHLHELHLPLWILELQPRRLKTLGFQSLHFFFVDLLVLLVRFCQGLGQEKMRKLLLLQLKVDNNAILSSTRQS